MPVAAVWHIGIWLSCHFFLGGGGVSSFSLPLSCHCMRGRGYLSFRQVAAIDVPCVPAARARLRNGRVIFHRAIRHWLKTGCNADMRSPRCYRDVCAMASPVRLPSCAPLVPFLVVFSVTLKDIKVTATLQEKLLKLINHFIVFFPDL